MSTTRFTSLLGLIVFPLTAAMASPSELPTPTPTASPASTPAPSPTPKVLVSFNGLIGGRYDVSNTSGNAFERIQDSVVFGFTITPAGVVDLVGLLQTGSKYGKRYDTVIDLNDHSKDHLSTTLYFKQIYLQKKFQTFGQVTTAQAGVIGTNQKIGTQTSVGPTTAIGTNAWIEGGRLAVQTKAGDFSVTLGSISDQDVPEIHKRDFSLNYFEVQMSKNVLDKISLEASAGKFDGEVFIRGAFEYDIKMVSERIVRLIQEGLYTNGTFSYSTTASTDLGSFIHKNLAGRVNLDLRYSYVSPNANLRAQAMNDLVLKGHVFSTSLYGKVDRTGRLNWFTAKDFGNVKRFQAGLTWKFKGGNKK